MICSSVWQHIRTVIDRAPVAGWLIGVVLGLGFSWMPCRWIDRATYNSRAFLPAVEAMAAGNPEMAIERLKEIETQAVFDRLYERPELRVGVRSLIQAIREMRTEAP